MVIFKILEIFAQNAILFALLVVNQDLLIVYLALFLFTIKQIKKLAILPVIQINILIQIITLQLAKTVTLHVQLV